ncbi:Agamous-like MADS-box protein AGL80 [Camellia lanceoleosa]|uniref:Agamous-like MADS-box protein AGL80 n=1 Tax=Camellia lanceoleosa TaxID=1840588 RepID=A0ACC0IKG6_9ERIC|nr:Agamous-like MADS-box protein AGL80 [Camellia lanceoleosa]
MPKMEQSKKMEKQESSIRQRIMEANEQLKKQQKDNREKEMTELMYRGLAGAGLENLEMADLHDLGRLIDQKLKQIDKQIKSMETQTSFGISLASGTSKSTDMKKQDQSPI